MWSFLNRVARALCQFKYVICCYVRTHYCSNICLNLVECVYLCVCYTVWLAQNRTDFADHRSEWCTFPWRRCTFNTRVSVRVHFPFCFTCVYFSSGIRYCLCHSNIQFRCSHHHPLPAIPTSTRASSCSNWVSKQTTTENTFQCKCEWEGWQRPAKL